MTRDDMISLLEKKACYEAIYIDSDGRQIVVIRGLELYGFIHDLIKEEREACAKICETLWDKPHNGMATEEECYGAQCADAIRSRVNG